MKLATLNFDKKNIFFFFYNTNSVGMAWNFRFAALNRNKMAPIMVLPQQYHMDIGAWLDLLDLQQYRGKFHHKKLPSNEKPFFFFFPQQFFK